MMKMLHRTSQKNNFSLLKPNKPNTELQVLEPWFSLLKTQKKNVEARVYKDFYQTLTPGQELLFTNPSVSEKFPRTIKSVQVYKDFETLLENESLEDVLPGVGSLEEVRVSDFFDLEEVKLFGVLAIRFVEL
eukprot:TRINITY_DN1377_c0_g1_i2.p1 TRINITY_DN1377_c0_g1~~TRINITY_DN1377_c0_g1_i2.p1  ORF type:complete len:132 (+),score=20.09 TRINITY_DN1377_c0_g1_i2:72-467(+)